VERQGILAALEACDWVIGGPGGAAARLGLKRTTLNFKMKKLGLERGK
jgi:formate hydrogenlyase transcriptional activator